jgi:hypothetical protein
LMADLKPSQHATDNRCEYCFSLAIRLAGKEVPGDHPTVLEGCPRSTINDRCKPNEKMSLWASISRPVALLVNRHALVDGEIDFVDRANPQPGDYYYIHPAQPAPRTRVVVALPRGRKTGPLASIR